MSIDGSDKLSVDVYLWLHIYYIFIYANYYNVSETVANLPFQIWGLAAVTKTTTCQQHFSYLPSSLSQEALRSRALIEVFYYYLFILFSSQHKDLKAKDAKYEELSSTIINFLISLFFYLQLRNVCPLFSTLHPPCHPFSNLWQTSNISGHILHS